MLDHLMPHLLSDVCAREDAAVTPSRITALLVGIVTRTTYLALLSEFPAALKHLISLCAASPMIASQLRVIHYCWMNCSIQTPFTSPWRPMPTAMSCASIFAARAGR